MKKKTVTTTPKPVNADTEADFDPFGPMPHSDAPNLYASYFNAPLPVTERVDLGVTLPDDGLTPEQRRLRLYSKCDSRSFTWLAQHPIEEAIRKVRFAQGQAFDTPILAQPALRDTSSGVYVPTIETFNNKVAAIKRNTPDQNAAEILVTDQPWRKACALTEDRQTQPVPTFGPMLLPESRDPVAALENPPGPELRPTHWSPEANPSDILMGIVHDLSNCTSALSARLAVSLGHQPDSEAVNNLRTLTRSAKTLQNILHAETERRSDNVYTGAHAGTTMPATRKPGPGRPRKFRLPEDSPAVTLRVELIQKRKKYAPRKPTLVTPEESTREVVKNNDNATADFSLVNPAESTAEVVKNKTPENLPKTSASPT